MVRVRFVCGYMMLNRMRRITPVRTEFICSWSLRRVLQPTCRARGEDSRRHNRRLPPPHYRGPCIASAFHVTSSSMLIASPMGEYIYCSSPCTEPILKVFQKTLADGVYEQEYKLPDIIPVFFLKILYHMDR